jgi:DNA recombination protein RmuC
LIPTAQKTVLSPAIRINKLGVAGDREKLGIDYPDAPSDVRDLSNADIEGDDDYIDVEIVETEEKEQ